MSELVDAETERCVLSACMQRTSCLPDAVDMGVDQTTFGNAKHRIIWNSLAEAVTVAHDADTLDPVTVHRIVRRAAPEVGLHDIAELYTMVSNTANLKHHVTVLIDLATRRKIISQSRKLADKASDITSPLDDLVTSMQDIGNGQDTGLILMGDAVNDTTTWTAKNKHAKLLGRSTGLRELDSLTSGFQPGQLIILAARPSKGKSALAWQMAQTISSTGPVLFVSLEMDARAIVLRSLSQSTGISIGDLSRYNIPKEAQDIYDYAVRELAERPIHIDERGSVSLQALRSRAKRLHRVTPLELIVVDYLQLMQSKGNSREQEVSQISRGLKALAMDLRVPVLACAQLNRSIEMRSGEASRPTLSDLRDSGQIEQDADIVTMLWWGFEHCNNMNHGDCELLIRKNRQGALGTVNLKWEPQWVSFQEATQSINQ